MKHIRKRSLSAGLAVALCAVLTMNTGAFASEPDPFTDMSGKGASEPWEVFTDASEDKPYEGSGQIPGKQTKPTDSAEEAGDPETEPGSDPEVEPGSDSGAEPGSEPEAGPEIDPEVEPGSDAETDPGLNPETDPEFESRPAGAAEITIETTGGSISYYPGSKGTWNPQTHCYENATSGQWVYEDGGNEVILRNYSDEDVNLTVLYEPSEEHREITGSFTDVLGNPISGLTVPSGEYVTVYLQLAGEPETKMMNNIIGDVTYTIAEEE